MDPPTKSYQTYTDPSVCVCFSFLRSSFIAAEGEDVTERFRFLGRVLGKAVYENILVEPRFADFFLNKLLGKYNYVDDLHSLDPEVSR